MSGCCPLCAYAGRVHIQLHKPQLHKSFIAAAAAAPAPRPSTRMHSGLAHSSCSHSTHSCTRKQIHARATAHRCTAGEAKQDTEQNLNRHRLNTAQCGRSCLHAHVQSESVSFRTGWKNVQPPSTDAATVQWPGRETQAMLHISTCTTSQTAHLSTFSSSILLSPETTQLDHMRQVLPS